jgi:hypothetical protein
MTGSKLSGLQEIVERYEHALEMARESRCTCNTARNPAELARDIVEYLLASDHSEGDGGTIRVVARPQHCPVHSPPVSERPWLLEVELQPPRERPRRLEVGTEVFVRGGWGRVSRKVRFVSVDQPGKFLVEGLDVLLDEGERGASWDFDGEAHS